MILQLNYVLCLMSHPGCNLTLAQFQVGPALKLRVYKYGESDEVWY